MKRMDFFYFDPSFVRGNWKERTCFFSSFPENTSSSILKITCTWNQEMSVLPLFGHKVPLMMRTLSKRDITWVLLIMQEILSRVYDHLLLFVERSRDSRHVTWSPFRDAIVSVTRFMSKIDDDSSWIKGNQTLLSLIYSGFVWSTFVFSSSKSVLLK